MSTSIRRSSRRAAAKGATNATVDDGVIPNHSEKIGMALLKGDDRFPIPDNDVNQYNSINLDTRNISENSNGRALRRQTGSSSLKVTDDVNSTESVSTSKVPTTSRKRDGTVSPDSSNSNIIAEQDFENDANGQKAKKSRKTVTFDGSTCIEANVAAVNSESDTSKRSRTAAQLAREQRSRRRQAALGVEGSDLPVAVSTSRKPDNRVTHKKKVPGSSSINTENDANIVRVPMLTGTLVLYRGSNPRAVFIRRV